MSGGSVLKEGFDMAGDIVSNAPDFRLHIELKNAPGSYTGLHNLFSDKSAIWKWWVQTITDCPSNRIPILIVNRFDMPTFCIANPNAGLLKNCIIGVLTDCKIKMLLYNNQGILWIVWELDDMLKSDPEFWK